MDTILFSKLNKDSINVILSYNKYFTIRNGESVIIIPKDDTRYQILLELPKITKIFEDKFSYGYQVNFSNNNKLIMYHFTDDNSFITKFVKDCKHLNWYL